MDSFQDVTGPVSNPQVVDTMSIIRQSLEQEQPSVVIGMLGKWDICGGLGQGHQGRTFSALQSLQRSITR